MGWQNHENFIPSESWHRYSLPPSLMMSRAGAQQVEDRGRPAVWSSGWDWRCSSSTTPSSSCDFLPSRWGLLQGFNLNKQTVGSRLFTVVVVSRLTYTALRQLIFLICNNVQNRIYPFVTSLSSSHPARGSVHPPNFKHTQAQFSKHTGVAVAYTPHKGIERMDSIIIICVVKNTKARQNLTQYSVFSF